MSDSKLLWAPKHHTDTCSLPHPQGQFMGKDKKKEQTPENSGGKVRTGNGKVEEDTEKKPKSSQYKDHLPW